MQNILIRSIILLWPFLKRAIFGDRPVRDFLITHKQFIVIFSMVLFLSYMLLALSGGYRELSTENRKLKEIIQEYTGTETTVESECVIDDRKDILNSLLN